MSEEEDFDFIDVPVVNILIVEDDAADLVLLRTRIERIVPNCNVTAVKSIRGANDACLENTPDLILLDLNLPDGYGPSTVKDIRQNNKDVPIIVTTGFGVKLTAEEALKMGANSVVLKAEIESENFVDILRKNLES